MNAPTSLLLLLRWFTEMFDTKLWERRGFGHFLLFLQQSFEARADESPFSSSLPLSSLICFLWRLIIRLFFLSLPFLSQCTNTGAALIIGKDCAKVFIKLRGGYNSDLIKLTIRLFQASSSRQQRRSVWRTVVRPPTSPASSPSNSTGCSTTSAPGPPHTSLSINHGAQLLSTRLVSKSFDQ